MIDKFDIGDKIVFTSRYRNKIVKANHYLKDIKIGRIYTICGYGLGNHNDTCPAYITIIDDSNERQSYEVNTNCFITLEEYRDNKINEVLDNV